MTERATNHVSSEMLLTRQSLASTSNEEYPSMDKPLVEPGGIVNVRCLGAKLEAILVKTRNVKIVHLVIPTGMTVSRYEAQGEIILHCLEGRVSLAALGKTQELKAGQLSYFCIDELVSIQGIEHASLVATIITAKKGQNVGLIGDGD
jgi:quercetin dioxygenase-like cupin family protein